ncbi:MAG: hypothetical protein OXG44_07355 [Gammaproteobacteria bacterium]|nr:hypothetical protein [Gammaproteobacteria bacterium]
MTVSPFCFVAGSHTMDAAVSEDGLLPTTGTLPMRANPATKLPDWIWGAGAEADGVRLPTRVPQPVRFTLMDTHLTPLGQAVYEPTFQYRAYWLPEEPWVWFPEYQGASLRDIGPMWSNGVWPPFDFDDPHVGDDGEMLLVVHPHRAGFGDRAAVKWQVPYEYRLLVQYGDVNMSLSLLWTDSRFWPESVL